MLGILHRSKLAQAPRLKGIRAIECVFREFQAAARLGEKTFRDIPCFSQIY
jgi:hypothetical protein